MGGCYSCRVKEQKRRKASVSACRGKDQQTSSNEGHPGVQVHKFGKLKKHMLKHGVDLENIQSRSSVSSRLTQIEDTDDRVSAESKEEEWYESRASFLADSEDEYSSVMGDFLTSTGNTPVFSRSLVSSPQPAHSFLKGGMLQQGRGFSLETDHPLESLKSGTFPASVELHDKGDYDPSRLRLKMQLLGNESTGEMQRTLSMSIGQNFLEATSIHAGVVSATENDVDIKDRLSHDHSEKAISEGSCLPCLTNGIIFNDKRKITSSPSHSQKKKASQLFPLKERISLDKSQSFPKVGLSKEILEMPQAGKQVPYSVDAKEGCWSNFSPSSFKLRAPQYLRDRRKQPAPPHAIYEALGVDVFLAEKKINHIANFVELPFQHLAPDVEEIPSIFIINIQVPLYPASIFPVENDGIGLSLVFYFKLSENFKKEVPDYQKDMLKKLINNDMEKVRGLIGDAIVPFRERLKIVARVCNPDDIQLSAAERKLVGTYNEKPILSRPQHSFYRGDNYFEVDLDVHRFNFIARKAVEAFRERMKLCILDIGLTIQGNKAEELPEYLLCGLRVNKLDVANFHYLNTEMPYQEFSSDTSKGPSAI